MTNSMASIERFMTNLAAAYGWMPKRETVAFWSDKLLKFSLAEDQWARALSRIVSNEETRPSLAQVYQYLRAQTFKTGAELVPIFETFLDADGRCHAARTGRYTISVPSYDQLREWERGKATPEEARAAFRAGYLETKGDPKRLDEFANAIIKKPEATRKPLWYQEDEVDVPV